MRTLARRDRCSSDSCGDDTANVGGTPYGYPLGKVAQTLTVAPNASDCPCIQQNPRTRLRCPPDARRAGRRFKTGLRAGVARAETHNAKEGRLCADELAKLFGQNRLARLAEAQGRVRPRRLHRNERGAARQVSERARVIVEDANTDVPRLLALALGQQAYSVWVRPRAPRVAAARWWRAGIQRQRQDHAGPGRRWARLPGAAAAPVRPPRQQSMGPLLGRRGRRWIPRRLLQRRASLEGP